MGKIRIMKKNDEYSSEYEVGDIFEITGTWYGGVHILGKTGVPVSLDKEEYMELNTEPESKEEEISTRDIQEAILCSILKESGFQKRLQNIFIRYWHLHNIQKQGKGW